MQPEARQMLKNEMLPGVSNVQVEQLVRKWNARGLLEDIKDPYRRGITAILIENTAKGMRELKESGSVSTHDIALASRFVFPLVRRVWPGLVVNDLVSVQPMTMPVGAVCYLKVLYGTDKGATKAGDEVPVNQDRFYSTEFVKGEIVATGTAGNEVSFLAAFDFTPLAAGYCTITYTLGGQTHVATDSGRTDGKLYEGLTLRATVTLTNGNLVFEAGSDPDNATNVLADYKYESEMNTKVPEINLEITFDEIKALTRKIKAIWSPEAMEDMKALYAVDAEAEMVQQIGSEIALEIDREVIEDLYDCVDQNGDLTTTWDRTPTGDTPDIWHIQSLVHAISKISNRIHARTFRAPANWLVVSPEIAALLECIPQFKGDKITPGDLIPAPGIHRIGTLMDRWTVYRDPYFHTDYCMVGYKGTVFYDTGYVYAPYIPLQATPTFYDPDTFTMKKGLRTRYNKKLIRNDYYGLVKVNWGSMGS